MIVNDDDLDFNEDARTLDGKMFTGLARAYHQNGSLAGEWSYVNGFTEGVCREWHENGELASECVTVRGVPEGWSYEWHSNGRLKSAAEQYNGVVMSSNEWAEDGVLRHQYAIDPQSDMPRMAAMRRKKFIEWLKNHEPQVGPG